MNIICQNKAALTIYNNLKLTYDGICDDSQVFEYRKTIKNLISSQRHKYEDYIVTKSPESLQAAINVITSSETKLNESLLRFICLYIKNSTNSVSKALNNEVKDEISARICLISYHVIHSNLSVETEDTVKTTLSLLLYIAQAVFVVDLVKQINSSPLYSILEELFYFIAAYVRHINYKSFPKLKPTTYVPLIKSFTSFLSMYPTQINTMKIRDIIIDNNCMNMSEILGEVFSKLIENEQNYRIIYKIISPLFESINTTFNPSISSFLLTFIQRKPSIGLIYIQYIQKVIKSNSKNDIIRFALQCLLLLCNRYHSLPPSNYHLFLYALYHNTYKIQFFILNNMKELIEYLPIEMKNDFYWLSYRIINQILIENENHNSSNSLLNKYFDFIKYLIPFINKTEYKDEMNISMINMTYKLLSLLHKEEEYNIILNLMTETRQYIDYDIYKLLSLYSAHNNDNINELIFNFILLLISDEECHIITKYLYNMEIYTNKNDKLYENFICFILYLIKQYSGVMKAIIDSLNNKLYTLDFTDFPIEIVTLYYTTTTTGEVLNEDLQSTLSLKIQSINNINDSDSVFILLRYAILSKNELLLSSIIKYLPDIYNNSFSYSISIWKDIIFILHQFHVLDDFIYEQVKSIEKNGVNTIKVLILLYIYIIIR